MLGVRHCIAIDSSELNVLNLPLFKSPFPLLEPKAFTGEKTDVVGCIITKAALEDRKFLKEKLDVRQYVEELEKSIEEIWGAPHFSAS